MKIKIGYTNYFEKELEVDDRFEVLKDIPVVNGQPYTGWDLPEDERNMRCNLCEDLYKLCEDAIDGNEPYLCEVTLDNGKVIMEWA